MATLLKRCARLCSSNKSHILHDVRYSCITYSTALQTHTHDNQNIPRNSTFSYSSQNVDPSRNQQNATDIEHDEEEAEEEEDQDETIDSKDSTESEEDEDEDDELETDEDASDDESEDKHELTEAQKFLIKYRTSQGLQYEPHNDSEFVYKPIPRVPGPSPFINHDYKRQSVAKYQSIETLQLPISSVQPLGGQPEIWVHSSNATKRSIYKLSSDMFNQDVRIDILWRCVRYEYHKKRHWTWHIVKHRGEVRGTGKKLRKQKGTGKARMSDMKAPQCKGGGQAHGRRPRSVETNLKQHIYRKGIKIALSARYQEGDLYVFEDFVLPRLQKPEYLTNMELYQKENVNKHPELGDALVPIDELDWNENTKLYYDVYRTRQMLNKWGWLKPQLYERVNNNKAFHRIINAKKSGNIVDILESMPIADFEWDFLKEEDELMDHTIPTVLMIHDGTLNNEFKCAMDRVQGVDLMHWEELMGDINGDGSRHVPKMGVFRLLKYKKIVFSVGALKSLEDRIGVEADIKRWNYYALLNRIRQDEESRDAFSNHKKTVNVTLNSL
eukprot:59503_1